YRCDRGSPGCPRPARAASRCRSGLSWAANKNRAASRTRKKMLCRPRARAREILIEAQPSRMIRAISKRFMRARDRAGAEIAGESGLRRGDEVAQHARHPAGQIFQGRALVVSHGASSGFADRAEIVRIAARLSRPGGVDAAGLFEAARVAAPVAAAAFAVPFGHAFPLLAIGAHGLAGVDGALQRR